MRLKSYVEGPFEDDVKRADPLWTIIAWIVMIVAGAYLVWMVV
jgi:hypothetical protein